MCSGYQFEPEFSSGEENYSGDESVSDESESDEGIKNEERLKGLGWCSCQQCAVMETAAMCLCCNELESRKSDDTQGNFSTSI